MPDLRKSPSSSDKSAVAVDWRVSEQETFPNSNPQLWGTTWSQLQENGSELPAALGGLKTLIVCLGEVEAVSSVPLFLEAVVQLVGTA